jgi:TRAP-type C4-dicarboxylate transport system substrate-binding protein
MKKQINKLNIALILLPVLFFLAGNLHALTIKIGTVAPLRSPWIKELKQLGLEWKKITNGLVDIKVYAGGIAGSESDMIRKIRMGTLGGAVFTNQGITGIYRDAYALNIPFLLDSEAELDYVMEKLAPVFEEEIEKKGFKVLLWAKAGWVHFFSKNPVLCPEDLKKHRLSFTTGASDMGDAWIKAGYRIVPNELKDLMMALQSGMVDAFYLPPLLAASGQYFPMAPNMCSLPVAPLLGGLVISDKLWHEIPDQYKEQMIIVARRMADNLYKKTVELEKDAIDVMKKHKLVINTPPPDAVEKWKAASDKGMDVLIGKTFSQGIYDKMMGYLNEYRKGKKGNGQK